MSGGEWYWPPLTSLMFWFDLGREPRLPVYGTPVVPTSFIPFESEETLAEWDRANRARIALETLRSEPSGDYSPAPSCPSCVLGAARRLPPLGFPLVPLPGS